MTFFQRSRRWLTALALVLLLTVSTTACSTTASQAPVGTTVNYSQLERGNSAKGQEYGDWVVSAAQGLISDAYVRDDNKLGVVITDAVKPSEVRDLSRSLLQGFRKSFPSKDLQVLVFAPDKAPILVADYDTQSGQVEYSTPE
ncbi:MAG: hypothetical protein HC800_21965 [Phormidesmis sp. RL_2_1]|nr:hypothetical protein [Phormidesmis sp. RL_2_1]